jgi:hypothetical protein
LFLRFFNSLFGKYFDWVHSKNLSAKRVSKPRQFRVYNFGVFRV